LSPCTGVESSTADEINVRLGSSIELEIQIEIFLTHAFPPHTVRHQLEQREMVVVNG